jgi:hypothetical protein
LGCFAQFFIKALKINASSILLIEEFEQLVQLVFLQEFTNVFHDRIELRAVDFSVLAFFVVLFINGKKQINIALIDCRTNFVE